MKKLYFLMMMAATLFIVGCDKSDDEVDGGKSDSSRPSNMVGVWAGAEIMDSNNYLTLTLRADGTSEYLRTYSGQTKVNERGAKWKYNSSEKKLVISLANNQAYTFYMWSFTGVSMLVDIGTASGGSWSFFLTPNGKDSNNNGSGGSSGGYGGGGYDDGGGSGGSGGGGSTGYVCGPCGGSGRCSHCHASGKCPTCVGDGWYYSSYGSGKLSCPNCYTPGNDYRYGDGKCSFCAGTGKCRSCNGTGYK